MRKRYHCTSSIEAMLTECYAKANTAGGLSSALDVAQKATGWPRYMLKYHAMRLRLTRDTRRPWTTGEIRRLRALAGTMSANDIATELSRGRVSVRAQLERLRISYRVNAGETQAQAAKLLGVSVPMVRQWMKAEGLRCGERLSHPAVVRLFEANVSAIDLRTIDQHWLREWIGDRLEREQAERVQPVRSRPEGEAPPALEVA